MKERTKLVGVKLTYVDHAILEYYCHKFQVTKSDLIRSAISAYIQDNKEKEDE